MVSFFMVSVFTQKSDDVGVVKMNSLLKIQHLRHRRKETEGKQAEERQRKGTVQKEGTVETTRGAEAR